MSRSVAGVGGGNKPDFSAPETRRAVFIVPHHRPLVVVNRFDRVRQFVGKDGADHKFNLAADRLDGSFKALSDKAVFGSEGIIR